MRYLTHANNWVEALDVFVAAKNHYNANKTKMSQYEAETNFNELKAFKNQWQPVIEQGIIGEFESAANGYRNASLRLDQAKTKEAGRFSSASLQANQSLIKDRIKTELSRMNSFDTLEKVIGKHYEDGLRGDLDSKRATLEVMRGLVDMVPSDRRQEANRIAVKANRDLEALRYTPEIQEAEKGLQDAQRFVEKKAQDMATVGTHLMQDPTGPFGGIDPIGKAIRRVQYNEDGSLRILPADAQRISSEPVSVRLPHEHTQAAE